MSYRSIMVTVEVDDDVSQGDEFETLMGDVQNCVEMFIDPAIKRVKVTEILPPPDTPVSPPTYRLSDEARSALGWTP